jgi:hypothetical protein
VQTADCQQRRVLLHHLSAEASESLAAEGMPASPQLLRLQQLLLLLLGQQSLQRQVC